MARSDDAHQDLAELGALLRQHRKRAQLTGTEAARRAGFTQSKLSKIENGLLLPGADDVRRLATGFAMDPASTGHALELVRRLHIEQAADRIVLRRGVVTEHTALLAKLGRNGRVVAADPAVVPDWLRTPAYLLALTGPLPERTAKATAALRRKRRRLLAAPGFRYEVYVFEQSLGIRVGSPEIMTEQVRELVAVAEGHPNLVVRVVPARATVSPAPVHGFEVHDDRQVVITVLPGVLVTTSDDDVQPFRQLIGSLRESALSVEASIAYLRRLTAVYDHHARVVSFRAC
ncbi:Scr1 family TA system antitoxin-like transcriptional regulator [Nocardia sp. NRRL S-836]|uniref:Scr1 family TA system antitoxin-like transcriptional regulator n=1 Tax=Nocardia sp. NRRL S-836 TaxID=1519492 RepID=UPI0006B02A16|nr:Scr1 family TA system antitoxin-like transcriptional regulator [Nocardia sp. NRRL S-836]KOV84020.1 hypothetical protein ADL03_18585 [Nocardia sp. NRRL S-836]